MSTQPKSKLQTGNFFEDFRIGQLLTHATPRTITIGDVALYNGLYGSRFPLITIRDQAVIEAAFADGACGEGAVVTSLGVVPTPAVAYLTGRGRIYLRAKCDFEEDGGRTSIIVNELPYQVNKAKLMEKIAELDAEQFDQIAAQFPRFVGRDSGRYRSARQIANGAYIEANLSAESIKKFSSSGGAAILGYGISGEKKDQLSDRCTPARFCAGLTVHCCPSLTDRTRKAQSYSSQCSTTKTSFTKRLKLARLREEWSDLTK